MGHALLWNGYGEFAKSDTIINTLSQDLYDGYHTYALKWTPEYYVFYIDGEPTENRAVRPRGRQRILD